MCELIDILYLINDCGMQPFRMYMHLATAVEMGHTMA